MSSMTATMALAYAIIAGYAYLNDIGWLCTPPHLHVPAPRLVALTSLLWPVTVIFVVAGVRFSCEVER